MSAPSPEMSVAQDPLGAGNAGRPVIEELSEYVARAVLTELPGPVVDQTVLHILDTIAAAVSGTRLEAGGHARAYVERCGASPGCTVFGTPLRTSAPLAALANGMAAHADETDDSHAPSRTHPGCAVVPAAFSMAESRGRSGMELIRAVALGYDICGRVPPALWPEWIDRGDLRVHSTHAFGGLFGAASAAGGLAGLDARQCRYLFSYAAQQASGIRTYFRERHHVEKAFVFGGMPAMNGATVANMVEAGWTGVEDVFSGEPSLFSLGERPNPSVLTDELGRRFEILGTKFKKYAVGSPIQSPLEGLLSILQEQHLASESVRRVLVRIPTERWRTVHARPMSDLNIDYLLEAALDDGAFTFQAAHDEGRFEAWRARERDGRVEVAADESMHGHTAHVEVETSTGAVFRRFVPAIPGSLENPMSRSDVENKARDLMEPVIGVQRSAGLISDVQRLPQADSLRDVVRWLHG